MSQETDQQAKVRLTPEIRKWMDDYRKATGINTPYQALADALWEKGKTLIPIPTQDKKGK